MWWERLKNNPNFRAGVGVAVVSLGVYWLFSGALFNAFADASQIQPREGETKTGVVVGSLVPIAFQIALAVLIGVGTYALQIGEWLVYRVRGVVADVRDASVDDSPQAATAPASPTSLKSLTMDLGRAALYNDRARGEELRWKIRKPQAIAELSTAYEVDDEDAIKRLSQELAEAMHGQQSASSSRKKGGAANG